MTDPTTVLREAIKSVVIESEADDILATRIPQACQTCKGSGLRHHSVTIGNIDCPDCPTILTLLLYGWNVAQAKPFNNWLFAEFYANSDTEEDNQ